MSLAVFGLFLILAAAAAGYKNGRAVAAAVVGVMLGLTIAGSGGALEQPTEDLVAGIRTGIDSLGSSLFGGGK
ncbi:MAG: hypothetical protein GEV11_15665 [Streptosporangiales bacterium]|nr:hypothetical protein [Streptosporangiales bacterium]